MPAQKRFAQPISPAPVTKYQPNLLPAYVSNGIIGLRVRQIPFHAGVAVVNGGAAIDPTTLTASTPYAPYPLSGDIRLEDVWLSEALQQITYEEQRYDFTCGELHTRFHFIVNGITAHIDVLTFCSRSLPTTVLQQTQIQVDKPCHLALLAIINPAGSPGKWLARNTRLPGSKNSITAGSFWTMPLMGDAADSSESNSSFVDGSLIWEFLGGLSTCGVAYTTELHGTDQAQRLVAKEGEQLPLTTRYTFQAEPGCTYTFNQIASIVPSCYHHEPDWQATRLIYLAKERGFDALRQENRAAWEELWKGRILLMGAEERWQCMVDAAFFYLHSSIHHSSPASTTPFGLAMWPNYNYYYGHIMWDQETFVLPPLFLTAPDAALSMLTYRCERLPAARSNAKMQGYRGSQFPWSSSPTYGEETTPLESTSSQLEIHVTLDVAYAFAQYVHATDDEDFLQQQAWPVLKDVAEWIESRVTHSERGYEIKHVVGIAETSQPVNNNAYTNIAARVVLLEATALARKLGRKVPDTWEKIANSLVLPIDPQTHVLLNEEGYTSSAKGGSTPEALATFFPYPYRPGEQIEQATLAFYLPLAEKYAGKPMLSAFLGVYAAWSGNRELSTHFFEKGYADFLSQPFNITNEMPNYTPEGQPVGPFITNIGGFLMSCLYGLTRLRLGPGEPQSWCEGPIILPDGWDGIQVERIWIHGRPARLTANHGDKHAHIEFLDC
ncbi:MAG TPA: glycoside hydrolase family 65 protein [Ktedonobacter sp.]|nr:glycoside hydrolase family 65 protein [Ktedonobacter sp.]